MPIKFAEDADGIVTLVYSTNPTAAEGRAALDAVLAFADSARVRGYLIDRRSVTDAPSTAYVREMVSHAEQRRPDLRATRWATVVNSDAAYGMSRMIEALTEERVGLEFHVFRDVDAARAWLLEAPERDPTAELVD